MPSIKHFEYLINWSTKKKTSRYRNTIYDKKYKI